ncbi:unnamed protein product, partial [Ectocarpus sp. 12 AP-2014]
RLSHVATPKKWKIAKQSRRFPSINARASETTPFRLPRAPSGPRPCVCAEGGQCEVQLLFAAVPTVALHPVSLRRFLIFCVGVRINSVFVSKPRVFCIVCSYLSLL